jgi:hypothetical protein
MANPCAGIDKGVPRSFTMNHLKKDTELFPRTGRRTQLFDPKEGPVALEVAPAV